MGKCSICSEKLSELFLEKVRGTVIYKVGSSKQYPICSVCQKKFKTKEELLQNIK